MSTEKTFKIKDGDLSDGYHTFDELYEHRHLLFLTLVMNDLENASVIYDHYPKWDAILLKTKAGQISYHVPEAFRPIYEDKITERKFMWDGHTSNDVLVRLLKGLET